MGKTQWYLPRVWSVDHVSLLWWQDLGKSTGGLERVLLPLSSLAGWGLVTVGALMVLHVFGLNIQPLLTIGGVGGLAIGFGAQSVTSNAISGINLVREQPMRFKPRTQRV